MTASFFESSGLDEALPEIIQQQVEKVLSDELYWFPVRHHSPVVAFWLRQAIQRRRPKVIFVEAPSDLVHLCEYLVHRDTRPPVAFYSGFRDEANSLGLAGVLTPAADIPLVMAGWYPMLEYSPEYVAIKEAREIGAEVVFIDLPHHQQVQLLLQQEDFTSERVELDARLSAPDQDEQLLTGSQFYQRLTAIAGYRSWNECWDTLFETPGREINDPSFDPVEKYRLDLATFCAAARHTCDPADLGISLQLREAWMWKIIKEKLHSDEANHAGNAMVVCGGLHLFMPGDQENSVVTEACCPDPVESGLTIYNAIVPFSYQRVSEQSGYASGNRAPAYYQLVWKKLNQTRYPMAERQNKIVVSHTRNILAQARRSGERVSTADALSAVRNASMLAGLRGRTAPVLDDLVDAVVTCCCKGNPEEEGAGLLKAVAKASIGQRVGKVTAEAGQVPLIQDFYRQIQVFETLNHSDFAGSPDGSSFQNGLKKVLELDKREETDQQCSGFFHRLQYLDIPFAESETTTACLESTALFKERWVCQLQVGTEERLLNLSVFGDTIESVALSKVTKDIARARFSLGDSTAALLMATNMGLRDIGSKALRACEEALGNDHNFFSLCNGFRNTLTVLQKAAFLDLRREALKALLAHSFNKACVSLLSVASAPEEEEGGIVEALNILGEVYLTAESEGQTPDFDRSLYIEYLELAASASHVHYLRGCFQGMLMELKQLSPEKLAAEIVAFAHSGSGQQIAASEFIDGVMSVSQTSVFLGARDLVSAIDQLLEAADWPTFLLMLPHLRAAFDRLTRTQRYSLADVVAKQYGMKEAESLEFRSSASAALEIAKTDQKVAAIMKNWDLFDRD